MKTKLALCATLLTAGLTAMAAPLQRADVPADPIWVLHLDCDGLRPTVIGQFLLAEMDKPEAQAKFSAFQAIFSFDPRKQLHGLTLFSTGNAPEDAILLMYADFDPERLTTLAKAAQDYQTTSHNQHLIQNWIDEKKPAKNGVKPRTYAAIMGKNIVVFGQKESTVAQALDVLDRTAPSIAKGSLFPQLGAPGDFNFVQGAARKVELSDNDPSAAVFRLSKLIRLQMTEVQRQMTATLYLDTNDETVAGHLTSITQGLVALMKLQTAKPESVKLAEALAIKQEGAGVVINLSLPADDVVTMMKAGAERKAQAAASGK